MSAFEIVLTVIGGVWVLLWIYSKYVELVRLTVLVGLTEQLVLESRARTGLAAKASLKEEQVEKDREEARAELSRMRKASREAILAKVLNSTPDGGSLGLNKDDLAELEKRSAGRSALKELDPEKWGK